VRELNRTAGHYAVWVRAAVAVPCGLLGIAAAPDEHRAVTAWLVALVIAWCALRLWWTNHHTRRPTIGKIVAVDVLVLLGVGFGQVPAGAHDAGTWVLALVSITAVTYVYEWAVRPGLALCMAGLALSAYVAGRAATPGGHWEYTVPLALRGAAQTLLARGGYMLVRRRAWAADEVVARCAARRRAAAVTAARRADERRHLATLHDTASKTLLMVAAGAWDGVRWPLRAQAQHDLAALRAAPVPEQGRMDLAELLANFARPGNVSLKRDIRGPLPLPGETALAIFHGVAEAVHNVERHAEVSEAELFAAQREDGAVVVEVRDGGQGFDPAQVPAHRRGLAESIQGRMESVGGRAVVDSRPRHGTVVRWWWPDADHPAARGGMEPSGSPNGNQSDKPAGRDPVHSIERTRNWLLGGFRTAVLAVSVFVQFGFCLAQLIAGREIYTSLWPQIAAFALLTVVAVVCIRFAVARDAAIPPVVRWTSIGLVLLASLPGTLSVPKGSYLQTAHWSFGLIGWYELFLLFDLPLGIFAGFLGAHVTLSVAALASGDGPDPAMLATMGITAISVCGFQISVAMIVRLLHRIADVATHAAEGHDRERTQAAMDKSRYRDHKRRRIALTDTTVPLLTGLADGSLAPSDADVRSRCALEAARLRRLFAEYDEAPDQLVHELLAIIDSVERNGVTVQFAVRGQAVELPKGVRRALIDSVSSVFVAATSTVRATVIRTPRKVRLSVIAETRGQRVTLQRPPGRSNSIWSHVKVTDLTTGNRMWVEAVWCAGS
jgi:signal transduction histidine kinase